MIPGTVVKLGEHKYLIPPLNFKALKKHKPFIMRVLKGVADPSQMGDEDFDVMFDLIYMATKRNYPELSEDAFAEDLDMANVQPAMLALMQVSGFQESVEPGE